MSPPQLPADKANHFFYGVLVYLAAAALALAGVPLGLLSVPPCRIGLATSCAAALAKELADHIANRRSAAGGLPGSHEVSAADAVATVGGGLSCFIASWIAAQSHAF